MDEITTFMDGYLAQHQIGLLRPEADHMIWQIEREGPEEPPVFLKVPGAYLRSEDLSAGDLTRALEREDLAGRIAAADPDTETAWLLTRQTTGRTKELVLTETDPPADADRSLRQPPDAPGPVPR